MMSISMRSERAEFESFLASSIYYIRSEIVFSFWSLSAVDNSSHPANYVKISKEHSNSLRRRGVDLYIFFQLVHNKHIFSTLMCYSSTTGETWRECGELKSSKRLRTVINFQLSSKYYRVWISSLHTTWMGERRGKERAVLNINL